MVASMGKWVSISFAFVAALVGSARAQSVFWQSVGPYGGRALSLVVDRWHPWSVYAGTARGGVFKTVDGGVHWFSVSNGLPAEDAKSIVIGPQNTSTVYAALGTVYKSTDGGLTRWKVDRGLAPDRELECLAVDPRWLYVGLYGRGFERTYGGIFTSSDGGETGKKSVASFATIYDHCPGCRARPNRCFVDRERSKRCVSQSGPRRDLGRSQRRFENHGCECAGRWLFRGHGTLRWYAHERPVPGAVARGCGGRGRPRGAGRTALAHKLPESFQRRDLLQLRFTPPR